ncbi:myb-like protein O [Mytilus californianus]|uniref:myb-like protein O n=1 Tax=Mytilus californianus TaxID=6549 RepID=UPI0022460518|nr:myb-like protein O [Mytilus californianus]
MKTWLILVIFLVVKLIECREITKEENELGSPPGDAPIEKKAGGDPRQNTVDQAITEKQQNLQVIQPSSDIRNVGTNQTLSEQHGAQQQLNQLQTKVIPVQQQDTQSQKQQDIPKQQDTQFQQQAKSQQTSHSQGASQHQHLLDQKPVNQSQQQTKSLIEVIPAQQEVAQSQQVIPLQKQATLSQQQVNAEQNQATPSQKQAALLQQQATPSQQQATPSQKQSAPSQKQATPSQQATPLQQQATPSQQQAIPLQQQATPSQQLATQSLPHESQFQQQVAPATNQSQQVFLSQQEGSQQTRQSQQVAAKLHQLIDNTQNTSILTQVDVNLKQEVVQPVNQEVKQEVVQPVNQEIKQEVVQPVNQEIKQEVVQPVNQEVKQEVVQPVNQEIKQEVVQPVNQEIKQEVKALYPEPSQNFVQEIKQNENNIEQKETKQQSIPVITPKQDTSITPIQLESRPQESNYRTTLQQILIRPEFSYKTTVQPTFSTTGDTMDNGDDYLVDWDKDQDLDATNDQKTDVDSLVDEDKDVWDDSDQDPWDKNIDLNVDNNEEELENENNNFIEDTKKFPDGQDNGYFDEDDFNSVADKTGDFWDEPMFNKHPLIKDKFVTKNYRSPVADETKLMGFYSWVLFVTLLFLIMFVLFTQHRPRCGLLYGSRNRHRRPSVSTEEGKSLMKNMYT